MSAIPYYLKARARKELACYLSGSYPAMVQNPVLLLNFLSQRKIISVPSYTILCEDCDQPYFAVSCSVDGYEVFGEGNSKKAAKNVAAQRYLDLLLDDDDKMDEVYETEIQEFYKDDCTNIYSFEDENTVSSRRSELAPILVDPQGSEPVKESLNKTSFSSMIRSPISGLSSTNQFYESYFDPFKDVKTTGIISRNQVTTIPDSVLATENTNGGTFIPFIPLESDSSQNTSMHTPTISGLSSTNKLNENYFDPFKNVRTSSIISRNQITTIPDSVLAEVHKNDSADIPLENDSSQETPIQKSTISGLSSTNKLNESYFDPFKNVKLAGSTSRTLITTVPDSGLAEVDPNGDADIPEENDSSQETSTQKSAMVKNPFHLLFQKGVRDFKFIPRCYFTGIDDRYQCRIILNTHTSFGEGLSKKEAKMNAAANLLSKLENVS